MSAVERNILTVVEPTIELDELEITDVESGTENSDGDTMKEKPSKFSTMIPLIRINSYEVQGDKLETFELKCTGFYPTCKFSFYDRDGMFTARFFPKDGDIILLHFNHPESEIYLGVKNAIQKLKEMGNIRFGIISNHLLNK